MPLCHSFSSLFTLLPKICTFAPTCAFYTHTHACTHSGSNRENGWINTADKWALIQQLGCLVTQQPELIVVHKHQLGRTIDCFPSLAACIASPSTMKASAQAGSSQVRSSLNPPNPGSKDFGLSFNTQQITRDNSNSLYCSGRLLDSPEQQP